MIGGNFFITPHALHRFQERIAPELDERRALTAIIWSLHDELTRAHLDAHDCLWLQTVRPYAFQAVIDRRQTGPRQPLPAVTTILEPERQHHDWIGRLAPARREGPLAARQRQSRLLRATVWRYAGWKTPEWIAAQLQRPEVTGDSVRHAFYHFKCSPTRYQGYLTAGQARQRLGCSYTWIHELIKADHLIAHKNPGSPNEVHAWWLINPRSVDIYLERQRRKAGRLR